ncbi:MAG: NAD-dependent epimerase/dehydratase family protein [Clostridia bacterium]|nr:NAD-dependent epimerase/dehydratase family protein [Clostridia bacterium]
MKILVTGAGGYLGRGVVKELLDAGCEVVATDIVGNGIDKRAEIISADIFAIESPYDFFGKPDAVLHLAWRNGFVHNADSHIGDLPLHDRFLKKLIDSGIKRCCVMGTMHEIGFFEGSINENTPCSPMNPYGIAKNALRRSIEIYAGGKGIEFLWLRGYYIVSSDVKGASVFSKIAQAAAEGKTEFPFTMGLNQYDYLDYDEFCAQTAAASASDETGIINICSGRPEKLCDRVERFIKENGFNIKLKYGAFPDRPYDSKAVWGDDKKIRSVMARSKS